LNMEDRVHILEPVPHWQVTETIKTADASIIFTKPTCMNHFYSSPNKLFESALAGLPIIAPDLPEMKKLVEGKGIGIITKADDVTELTVTIKKMLANANAYRPNAEKLETIKNEYGWEAQRNKLITLYQQVLNRA